MERSHCRGGEGKYSLRKKIYVLVQYETAWEYLLTRSGKTPGISFLELSANPD